VTLLEEGEEIFDCQAGFRRVGEGDCFGGETRCVFGRGKVEDFEGLSVRFWKWEEENTGEESPIPGTKAGGIGD